MPLWHKNHFELKASENRCLFFFSLNSFICLKAEPTKTNKMQKNPIFVNPLLRKNSNLCFERKKLAPQPKTLLQKLSHLPTVLLRAHLYFQKVTSLFISALSPPSPSENSFVLPEVALCPLHPLVRWYVPACVLSRFSCV